MQEQRVLCWGLEGQLTRCRESCECADEVRADLHGVETLDVESRLHARTLSHRLHLL